MTILTNELRLIKMERYIRIRILYNRKKEYELTNRKKNYFEKVGGREIIRVRKRKGEEKEKITFMI